MKEMNDYSGEFLQDLKLGDFPPDKLVELLVLYSKLYIALDGFWYLTVKERFGDEEAFACDIETWQKVSKYEMAKITKQLNIQGNDVTALMKAMQITPWCRNIQMEIEIKNENNAILTVTYCPTLDALEKEGLLREDKICNIFGPKLNKCYASFFNPNIEVKCLKSPPRKSKDETCCQWQFKMKV